ncbi:TIGR03086 family metal-binding protein [Streptomyces sp. DSM 44915]|uniref:TIGR03086 family metal-binding protein n=1 Tax=Streptomyces chisholmiae TaxID=3075540 RepID=A0ABU2JKV2_9ACTN|nr:TIGR03086 family metal-binding protein [Streptomyces sp. DSM 44915]MDT0265363.1 TIGR03086 family metal-binding protein [Streptomyces sp. DSM 44915]
MSTTPVTAFAEVVDTFAALVEAVEADQWSAPTPCPEWHVGQLVGHLVAGQRTFAAVMGAELPPPALDADPAPEELKAAFRTSAAALLAAFEAPGALERTVEAPIGPVPGALALRLQSLEHLVHGWDLARAIGQKALFDEATVAWGIEFARGLVAQVPPGPGAPFAPSRPAPEDAPALDRLAALLGRDIAG